MTMQKKFLLCSIFLKKFSYKATKRKILSVHETLEMAAVFCRDLLIKLGVNEKNYSFIGDNKQILVHVCSNKGTNKPIQS